MSLSVNLAVSMAGTIRSPTSMSPLSRRRSARTVRFTEPPQSSTTAARKEVSIYKGKSDRPLGWKTRKGAQNHVDQVAKDAGVLRWDGEAKSTAGWHSLTRDHELWFSDGDCLIYLYARGHSQRGASFRVHYDYLYARCPAFVMKYRDRQPVYDPRTSDSYFRRNVTERYHFYISAPATATRREALVHDLDTRNVLAWIYERPLVGVTLSDALVGLTQRVRDLMPAQSSTMVVHEYMESQGYLDLSNSRDHSLAALNYAEIYRIKDLWIAGFAHCAGMNARLDASPEYKRVQRVSVALISRARFEMDVRLDRCGKSLSKFLERDLAHMVVCLPEGARAHLSRFRTFLHGYYVAQLGYYPPASQGFGSSFPKRIYNVMRQDFQELYDFLADEAITSQNETRFPPEEGISVLSQIHAFDQKHRYDPLMHPLPLLPAVDDQTPKSASKRFTLRGKQHAAKQEARQTRIAALLTSTNKHRPELLQAPLIQAYCDFERDCAVAAPKQDGEHRLSAADARKVRWILIYAVLQTLLTATKVPSAVHSRDVSYNLSVLTAGCPPWKEQTERRPLARGPSIRSSHIFESPEEAMPSEDPILESIKPDIDYLQETRRANSTPVIRRNSTNGIIRSPSFISSISRRSSLRRAVSTREASEVKQPKPQQTSFHEILVEGYGNGTKVVVDLSPKTSPSTTPVSHEQRPPKPAADEISRAQEESLADLTSRWSGSDEEPADGESKDSEGSTSSDLSDDFVSCRDSLSPRPSLVIA